LSIHLPFAYILLIGIWLNLPVQAEENDFPDQITLYLSEDVQPIPSYKLGILHGINQDQPDDALIDPVGFDYWRSGRTDAGFVDRLHTRRALYQFVLADSWGFGKGMRPPHKLKHEWAAHVRHWVRTLKDKVWIWEIWNEPNLRHFWRFTREDYFKTWKIAHDVIREELGNKALIAGPSFVKFDKDYLHAFLDFALKEKLQIDVLSWHSIRTRISAIPENVAYVRTKILNNPRYQALGIQRIQIDEFGGLWAQYSPGTTLTYLWQLENADVDAAARACWPNLAETLYYCDSDSLSGLLSDDLSAKRAPWWLFAKYKESREHPRLKITGQTVWLPAIAWQDKEGNANILAGLADASNVPKDITLRIAAPYRIIKAQRLTDLGEDASNGFTNINTNLMPRLQAGDVVWLVLHRP
jgi:hypothetical protein